MSLEPWLPSWSGIHRAFARLHGANICDRSLPSQSEAAPDFASLYVAYAEATVQASLALQAHGKNSPQFTTADIASMRLFHQVKKMQGLKKAQAN